jgi:hypothetical protein
MRRRRLFAYLGHRSTPMGAHILARAIDMTDLPESDGATAQARRRPRVGIRVCGCLVDSVRACVRLDVCVRTHWCVRVGVCACMCVCVFLRKYNAEPDAVPEPVVGGGKPNL